MADTTASIQTTTPAANDDKWSSQMYSKHASFVPALGAPVVQLLAPQPHERILDLGAGDGVLTLDLEKQCQSVVAIDASADMIEAARRNGCRDAQVVDGHDLVDHKELANEQFDAVFSSAGTCCFDVKFYVEIVDVKLSDPLALTFFNLVEITKQRSTG